jgi:5,10-methylenetetrahydrofolate reductase
MTYGPCGGVATDGGCEVDGHPCEFVSVPMPEWRDESPAAAALNPRASELAAKLMAGRVVVADFPARPVDGESLRTCARTLADVDAVLLGDSPRERLQFPPSYRARLVQDEGATAWVGLNARDRNRVALEAELAALGDLQPAGLHCVTGDHPAVGGRPDAAAVFDLDSTRLTALAVGCGAVVSVGESPTAPPQRLRPRRLRSKERAGASVCFVNHCGGPAHVARFVRAARAHGVTTAMIACVPLGTRDEMVEAARRMLDTGLVSGVNLSAWPPPPETVSVAALAEALAETAELLR